MSCYAAGVQIQSCAMLNWGTNVFLVSLHTRPGSVLSSSVLYVVCIYYYRMINAVAKARQRWVDILDLIFFVALRGQWLGTK